MASKDESYDHPPDKNMRLNILFIADVNNSAIATSSRAWKKIMGGEVLYSAHFLSPMQLLRAASRKNPDIILFTWRGALSEILKDSKSTKYLQTSFINSKIIFSVPDYLGLKPTSSDEQLLKFADGVTVVSENLYAIYSQMNERIIPILVLRDLPDLNAINKTMLQKVNKKSQVIWVGNSKWGEGLGYIDHKGFKRFIQPIFASLHKLDPKLETIAIDRGSKFIPLENTLEMIRNSKFLLQFSDSEGTGLPIIEACGLGTIPITRDVGIARELLQGTLQQFIVTNADEALTRISNFKNNDITEQLIKAYENYIQKCISTIQSIEFRNVPIRLAERKNLKVKTSVKNSLWIRLRWIYRFLRN